MEDIFSWVSCLYVSPCVLGLPVTCGVSVNRPWSHGTIVVMWTCQWLTSSSRWCSRQRRRAQCLQSSFMTRSPLSTSNTTTCTVSLCGDWEREREHVHCVHVCTFVSGWTGGGRRFGTEQAWNTEVCCTLTILRYFGAAHISITALCPVNIEHSNLQFPRDNSVAVPQMQRLIPKGRSFEKQPCDESPELHSNFAWL